MGDYEVLGTLGSGGMGIVYLARQSMPRRLVALKALQSMRRADPDAVRRFEREREVGSPVHPNIVTVYESFVHESVPFISMEYADAGSLRRYIGQLGFAEVVGVLEAMLAGLEHLDRHGIVHRDIKPENVMVTAAGGVKITDFGIARVLGDPSLTSTGSALGTPRYMAPEQSSGADVGAWTDLYSVGVVAYELLEGRRPTPHDRTPSALAALAQRHVRQRAWQPPRQRPATRFAAWLTLMLEPDPRGRYARAADAWADLEACAREILPDGWRHRDPLARIATAIDPFDDADAIDPLRTVTEAGDERRPWTTWRGFGDRIRGGLAAARRGPLVPIAIALVVVAYLAARLVVPADGESARPAATASTATLQIGLPAGWKRLPRTPGQPALGLRESIRVGPSARGPALTAGIVDVDDPSLLPAGRVELGRSKPEVVSLGSLQALRHRRVAVRGSDGRWTLYAVPTSEGVVLMACPERSVAFAVRCERVAATLELLDISAAALGPDDAYARSLAAALSVLDRARRIDGRTLAKARTGAGQARAATALAGDHETSRLILERVDPGPAGRGIHRDLVGALRRLRTQYRRLASAARRGGPRRYRAAAREIEDAEATVDGALRRLRDAGYSIARR